MCPAFPGPRGQTVGSWPGARSRLWGSVAPTGCPALSHREGTLGHPNTRPLSTEAGKAARPSAGRIRGKGQGPQAFNRNIFRTHLCGGIPPTPFSPASSASTVRLSSSSPLPGRPAHLPSHLVLQPCGRVVWCQGQSSEHALPWPQCLCSRAPEPRAYPMVANGKC